MRERAKEKKKRNSHVSQHIWSRRSRLIEGSSLLKFPVQKRLYLFVIHLISHTNACRMPQSVGEKLSLSNESRFTANSFATDSIWDRRQIAANQKNFFWHSPETCSACKCIRSFVNFLPARCTCACLCSLFQIQSSTDYRTISVFFVIDSNSRRISKASVVAAAVVVHSRAKLSSMCASLSFSPMAFSSPRSVSLYSSNI